MPRLKGRRSPTGLSLLLLLLFAVLVALPLEYFGVTNFISNASNPNRLRPIAADDSIDKIDNIDK